MIEPVRQIWHDTAQNSITVTLPTNATTHQAPNDVQLIDRARVVSGKLKAIANKNRLIILFHLYDKPKSVSELSRCLNMRQPAVSQNLARLRADNIVGTTRYGKQVVYHIQLDENPTISKLMSNLMAAPV